MRAALADRQLGGNSRGVSSLLTVWRLPYAFAHLHFGVSRTNRNATINKARHKVINENRALFYALPNSKKLCLASYIDRNRMSNLDWRAFK